MGKSLRECLYDRHFADRRPRPQREVILIRRFIIVRLRLDASVESFAVSPLALLLRAFEAREPRGQ